MDDMAGALSLPNGFTATGLPLSLHICCRGHEDALQRAADHHLRVPPLVV